MLFHPFPSTSTRKNKKACSCWQNGWRKWKFHSVVIIEIGILTTGVVIVEIEREQFRYGVVVVSIRVVVVVKNGVFRFFIKNGLLSRLSKSGLQVERK